MGTNRLFVSRKKTFEITVLFTKEGKMDVSSVEDVPDAERDKWEEFTMRFRYPDFGVSKLIMRNATVVHNGENILDFASLNNALLQFLAVGWNLKDDNEKELKLDLEKLNEMRPDITRAVVNNPPR